MSNQTKRNQSAPAPVVSAPVVDAPVVDAPVVDAPATLLAQDKATIAAQITAEVSGANAPAPAPLAAPLTANFRRSYPDGAHAYNAGRQTCYVKAGVAPLLGSPAPLAIVLTPILTAQDAPSGSLVCTLLARQPKSGEQHYAVPSDKPGTRQLHCAVGMLGKVAPALVALSWTVATPATTSATTPAS